MKRSDIKQLQSEFPIGDPFSGPAYWEKRDFIGDIFGGGDAPAAPDYTPVAQASEESARIAAAQADRVLAESTRQYERNMAVAQPVIDQQIGLMKQQQTQGDDYYNYMKSMQRPVENALNAESMTDTTGRDAAERNDIYNRQIGVASNAGSDRQAIMDRYSANANQDATERGLITGGNEGIYNARRGDIEYDVGNAIADTRAGQSSAINQTMRQGLRYGYSPAKLAAMAGSTSLSQGAAQAAAANGTRQNSIDKQRALMGQRYDMRNATNNAMIQGLTNNRSMRMDEGNAGVNAAAGLRSMGIQDRATQWGKKLDAAGLYRGLTGASQGAYGLSVSAGNSAASNSMAAGQPMIAGTNAAANMTMQGQGQKLQGLTSIAGMQSQNYNTAVQNDSSGLGSMLGMAKMGLDIYTGGKTAWLWGK
jgi:hypothetical protein